MARNIKNTFVSTSNMTREERRMVANFTVQLKPASQHGNAKSNVWLYFGTLCHEGTAVDDRLYCRLCLQDIQKVPTNKQHISSVQSYKQTTSTANLISHLAVKHEIIEVKEEAINRVTHYFKSYATNANASASSVTSLHEFNRDMAIWFCRDLITFNAVEKDGFKSFVAKHMPGLQLPTAETIGR